MDGETGEVLWSKTYQSPSGFDESVYAIAADSDGNAYVTGRQIHGLYDDDDIMTMRLNAAEGEIEWRVHDGGPTFLDDRGWDVAVGPDDNPVVTGILSTLSDPAIYRTIKYDRADGSVIWAKSYPGAINHIDREAGWLAVCDGGDIIMANRTWGATTSYDVVLHRYDAATGDTVWTRQYNSSGASADDPLHMCRDAAGDILVAGVISGDYLVVKFDESNGDDLWTAIYDGPAGGYDTGSHVIEGPNGEVVVTGFCTGSGTSWDVTTVAFDPADGALLWDEPYDPGDGRADEGTALAVSAHGDLYVTGYGGMAATGSDMLALRYTLPAATGVAAGGGTATGMPSAVRMNAWPNPFGEELALSLDSDRSRLLRVVIYDVRGRRRSVLYDGELSLGRKLLTWDGRGADGRLLPPGVYFVRLEGAGVDAARKITLRR